MIVAVLDERRRFRRANVRNQTEMARMRCIITMQADRVLELREDVSMEQERTNVLREQLQVVNDRLTRVVREVRNQVSLMSVERSSRG